MKENIKRDYLRYLFNRTRSDLMRYNISNADSELIKNLFDKISRSENPAPELYILFHIKEFKNLSKYFIFISKKIEDNVISFDNLLQNLRTDSEYIENEILMYLSNPTPKEILDLKFPENKLKTSAERYFSEETHPDDKTSEGIFIENELPEEAEEKTEFTRNFLELIQSDETNQEIAYELPLTGQQSDDSHNGISREDQRTETAFDLPDEISMDQEKPDSEQKEDADVYEPAAENSEDIFDKYSEGDNSLHEEQLPEEQLSTNTADPDLSETDSDECLEDNFDKTEKVANEGQQIQEQMPEQAEVKAGSEEEDPGEIDIEESGALHEENRIKLSEEIQEELNLFKGEETPEEDELSPEEIAEPQPTNALFLEYEEEIKEKNVYLKKEFERMRRVLTIAGGGDEERKGIIDNIIETSNYLEGKSRSMSLEIISNIYQTITLSFEKISDSKYDISESTLNLFHKGLSLVIGLIKGDDYYGYKDILKSIENIRNTLLEEKQKRETYLRRLKEQMDLENKLDEKYPNENQKERLLILKKKIMDTEANFKSLEKITGEYQIYEALRSLSASLNNFKNIVVLAKELRMNQLVKLSEAGYIFIKFLQNYRINPVTIEIMEIFGYIIFNLKSLVVGKPVEDIELFISYLNDPVKIFSKTGKKKT